MSPARSSVSALLVAALFSLNLSARQELPPPLRGGPPSKVPLAYARQRRQCAHVP